MKTAVREASLDAVLLAGLALLFYLPLGQQTLYGDAVTFLRLLEDGITDYERHVLYLPVVHACHRLLGALGGSLYQSALLLSQIGGALAVGLTSLVARAGGLRRGAAWLAAAAFGLCPGTVFFATIVELHGAFLAPMALAWLSGAALARRPGVRTAVAVGLATVLATGMHSSGALLPVPVLGAFVLDAWPVRSPVGWRRRIALSLLAGGLHTFLVLALTGGLRQFAFVVQMAPVSLALESHVSSIVAWEWLWPFLPFSVLFALGLRDAEWRGLALVMLASLCVYLVPTYLVLSTWREYGAYFLPLALLATVIVAGRLRPATTATAIALAALFAVGRVIRHDAPERPRGYAAGVRALAGGRPVLLLAGDHEDLEAHFVAMPDVGLVLLTLPPFIDGALGPQALAALDRELDAILQRGEVVLLSRGAESRLADPRTAQVFPAAAAILPHLQARYELTEVREEGFVGKELRRRQ